MPNDKKSSISATLRELAAWFDAYTQWYSSRPATRDEGGSPTPPPPPPPGGFSGPGKP